MLNPSIKDGLGEAPQTRKSRRPDADATGRTIESDDEDDPDDTDGNDSDILQILQNLKFIYKQIKYYIFVFSIKPHCILNVFCTNVALTCIESHSACIDCPCFCQFEF